MAPERRGDPRAPPLVGTGPSLLLLGAMVAVLLIPTGDSPARQLMLPNLAVAPLVLLTLKSREGIGPVGAFLAGLAVDVLTLGPLGLFAAAYLVVHALLRYGRDAIAVLPRSVRLPVLAAAVAGLLGLTWATVIAAGGDPPKPVNLALAFAGLMLLGLAIHLGLLVYDRDSPGPAPVRKRRRPKPGRSTRRPGAFRRPVFRSRPVARRT